MKPLLVALIGFSIVGVVYNEASPIRSKTFKRGLVGEGNQGVNGIPSSIGGGYGGNIGLASPNHGGATVSVITQTRNVPVPQPVDLPVYREVPVEIPKPHKVVVPRPIFQAVPQPQPYIVPRPVRIEIPRPVPVPVPHPVRVPVHIPVEIRVPQPYPVYRQQPVPVSIPQTLILPYRVGATDINSGIGSGFQGGSGAVGGGYGNNLGGNVGGYSGNYQEISSIGGGNNLRNEHVAASSENGLNPIAETGVKH
ncbi:hypothetical protein Trydic_g17330 [Trypoxylus dichotomus]